MRRYRTKQLLDHRPIICIFESGIPAEAAAFAWGTAGNASWMMFDTKPRVRNEPSTKRSNNVAFFFFFFFFKSFSPLKAEATTGSGPTFCCSTEPGVISQWSHINPQPDPHPETSRILPET